MDEIINKDIMKHKILTVMSITVLALGIILAALLSFWRFYPYKTIEFNGNYATAKTEYRQGDKTHYIVDYCKFTSVFPDLQKKFVDGIEFTTETRRAILTEGCRKELVSLSIPDSLPPGRYRLQVTLCYKMNPIRTIKKVAYSNWFTVKQSPDLDVDNFVKEED